MPLDAQGGFAEDDRPWERPGAVRRDVEPHRGAWLLVLGYAALVVGLFSLCCLVPSLLTIPLGGGALWLSARDLRRMRARALDRGGEAAARMAWDCGLMSLVCGLASWALWGGIYLLTSRR